MGLFDEKQLIEMVTDALRTVVREEFGRAAPGVAEEFLSVAQAARLAGIAAGTIRAWMMEGKLRRYHAGRVLRVKRSELEQLLSEPPVKAKVAERSPEEEALVAFERRRKMRPGPR